MLNLLNNKCQMSKLLAYSMLIYTFSSIYYLAITQYIGTPFKDSLSHEQLQIKQNSAKVRREIFYKGIMYGIILIYLIQPFSQCK